VIDFCVGCDGILFDGSEIEALMRAITDVEQAKAVGSYRAAPEVKCAIGARAFK
jgi:hypothetical protein